MSEDNPGFEIVSDVLFERRGGRWLFQVATSGAVSYCSADGRLGWRSLAPAAAIETNLHRGQLAECKSDSQPPEVTLSFRYPRLPVTETMTIRLLDGPAAMTIDRVLHNAGTAPLPVHEARMLAVDGGGVFFDDISPTDLHCVYAGDMRQAARPTGCGSGETAESLPGQTRLFGNPDNSRLPVLAICNAGLTTFLLEASLRQGPFVQMWQIRAHEGWQRGRPVLADYASIARARPPIQLLPGQEQAVSSLFYQVRTGCDLRTLCDDGLAEYSRRGEE